jgi:membrane protein YqaA with SNARE-associated domain
LAASTFSKGAHTLLRSVPLAITTFLFLLGAIGFAAAVFSGIGYLSALPYFGLFMTSLVAGTVLPFLPASSEVAMAGLIAAGSGAPALLVAAAIMGNFTGASLNYLVGRNLARFCERSWFPISSNALQRTTQWFSHYGVWLLLMCWLPMAGDAITVVAGLLRADLRLFLILTASGKAFGHVAVASGVSWMA